MAYKKLGKLGYWIISGGGKKRNNLTVADSEDSATSIADDAEKKVVEYFKSQSTTLLGAKYEFLAYAGFQAINTITNHAIIAKQTITTANSTINIVLVKIAEKNGVYSIYAIEPILENAKTLGGYAVNPKVGKDIPEEAIHALNTVTAGLIGSTIEPIALLATKITKGVDYIFIVKSTPVYPDATTSLKIACVNEMTHTFDIDDILE